MKLIVSMEPVYDTIKKELCGTWILDRSENVEAYLIEMGLGNCERKTYCNDNGKQTITVTGDIIDVKMVYGKRTCQSSFRLNEEFTINAGKPSRVLATWENDTLVMRVQRIDSGKVQIIKRKRDGATLIQSMTYNGVTCRRFMKRQPP